MTPDKNWDSTTLYEGCQSSDSVLQTRAYQVLWDYVYRVAWHLVYQQPNATDLAEDCAQKALIRIHERFIDCDNPAGFRTWARRIVSNLTIDWLRREKRLAPLEPPGEGEAPPEYQATQIPSPEKIVLQTITAENLKTLINQAPISDRSQRVILGRYFEDEPDEVLAKREHDLTGQPVLPSHIQVTRSKNFTKLKGWSRLQAMLAK